MKGRRGNTAPIKIRWTDRALDDLIAIGDYISRDNPSAARRLVMKLVSMAESIAQFPLSGRVVPEFGVANIREKLLGSYRLVYRIKAGVIEVLTVFEGHRLLRESDARDADTK